MSTCAAYSFFFLLHVFFCGRGSWTPSFQQERSVEKGCGGAPDGGVPHPPYLDERPVRPAAPFGRGSYLNPPKLEVGSSPSWNLRKFGSLFDFECESETPSYVLTELAEAFPLKLLGGIDVVFPPKASNFQRGGGVADSRGSLRLSPNPSALFATSSVHHFEFH